MIDFQKLDPAKWAEYEPYILPNIQGCECSLVNLSIWGNQQVAVVGDYLTIFSRFGSAALYPFPLGSGPLRPVLDAIMQDAKQRGIRLRISSLDQQRMEQLETLYPGRFVFHYDRDFSDYVYHIDDLADLKGRKFQKKRNHVNKFRAMNPTWRVEPLTPANLAQVCGFAEQWYQDRARRDPENDISMEKRALAMVLEDPWKFRIEGLLLLVEDQIMAFTMGSRLKADTFDVHFEKAMDIADGAYPAINQAFASYLRDKYPAVRYLNREDDMGLPGLRKAKLSYEPAFLVEKHWAGLREEENDG